MSITSLCAALEWPIQDFTPIHFFGQRTGETIDRGLTLTNKGPVRASADGKLLMQLEENQNMTGFPSSLGNAAFVIHEDGLLTVYGNLSSLDRTKDLTSVETGTILSDACSSGLGTPGTFTFLVLDVLKKRILNPLMLLPPLKDTKGPVLKNVIAISSQTEQSVSLASTKSLKQGKWRLYAEVTDQIDGYDKEFCPFRISVLINGSEQSSIPFEILEPKNNRLYLFGSTVQERKIYEDPTRTFLGEIQFIRGKTDLSIIARDIAGNERSVLYGLQIE